MQSRISQRSLKLLVMVEQKFVYSIVNLKIKSKILSRTRSDDKRVRVVHEIGAFKQALLDRTLSCRWWADTE